MERQEIAELTTVCLIHQGENLLMQNRVKKDWRGWALPGGHIDPGESIVDSVIREMQEETGLTVENPKLCGVKQFPIEGGRYLVFLFVADQFSGEIVSSEEGTMHWVKRKDLTKVNPVNDFHELLEVMLDENLSEFQYVVEDGKWKVVQK